MLAVENLTRSYGARLALDRVSFTVERGEVMGVLGPNGAGKSTLLRILAGVLPPDSGLAEVEGIPVWSRPLDAKRRVGFAPEEPSLYDELSAEQYLAFLAAVHGMEPRAAQARALDLLDRLGLAQRAREPASDLSHGMRKKLSFAAAVLHRPPLVLCDDALEGFDINAALAAKDELRARSRSGSAVLFSSHVAETVEQLCDRVLILDRGRLVRTAGRAEWDAEPGRLSPLERIYVDSTRIPSAGEGAS